MRSANYRILVCLSVLFFVAQPALADTYYCDGQVNNIGLTNGAGRLWLAYGAIGWQAICDVDATFNGVQANACRAWLALLTTAHAQQKSIRVHYDTATAGNPASCSGFQSWVTYSPYFIQTVD